MSKHNTKQMRRLRMDIESFKHMAMTADIEVVGKDHDYVPDSPQLKKSHPNTG